MRETNVFLAGDEHFSAGDKRFKTHRRRNRGGQGGFGPPNIYKLVK